MTEWQLARRRPIGVGVRLFLLMGATSALLGSAVGAHAAGSEPGILKLSTGFDYSTGDYGLKEDTEILYLPLTAKYEKFPWTARLTVPYLRVKSPGNVVVGADGQPIVVSGTTVTGRRVEQHGLGDIITALTYTIYPGRTKPIIDLTAKVKFGTADRDKGLGTGENDYIIQADYYQQFGAYIPLATLGYKFRGKAPGFNIQDVPFATLGLGYKFGPKMNAGLLVDWQEKSNETSQDLLEAVPYLTWKFTKSWSLNAYGVSGFSNASPAWGVGAQVSFSH